MTTYVYGIARRGHGRLPEQMGGIGDPPRPVRTVEQGELVALVSDAPEELKPKRRDLLAHQNVLAEAGAGGPVLPMRFGGVSTDDEAVRAVLAEHEERYLERLQALDGKVEYNVKATHDEEAVLHQVLADNAELRALSEANRKAGGGTYEDKAPARRTHRRRRAAAREDRRRPRGAGPAGRRRGAVPGTAVHRLAGQHLLPRAARERRRIRRRPWTRVRDAGARTWCSRCTARCRPTASRGEPWAS